MLSRPYDRLLEDIQILDRDMRLVQNKVIMIIISYNLHFLV